MTTPGAPFYNVYDANCPTREALDRIADKWTALLIGALAERPRRFGELRRKVDAVSQKRGEVVLVPGVSVAHGR